MRLLISIDIGGVHVHYSPAEAAVGLNHNPRRSIVVNATAGAAKGGEPLPVVPGLLVELNLLGGELRPASTNSLLALKIESLSTSETGHNIHSSHHIIAFVSELLLYHSREIEVNRTLGLLEPSIKSLPRPILSSVWSVSIPSGPALTLPNVKGRKGIHSRIIKI